LLVLFLAALLNAATAGPNPEISQELASIVEQEELQLEDLFRIAEESSPAIAAARSRMHAGSGSLRRARRIPNPQLGIEVEEWSTSDRLDRMDKVKLVQPLASPGRRRAAIASARAEQTEAAFSLDEIRRRVRFEIHSLSARIFYLRELEQTLRVLLEEARLNHRLAQVRFEARAAPESHVTRALVEVLDLESETRNLSLERSRVGEELTRLLGGLRIPIERLAGMLPEDGVLADAENLDTENREHPANRAAAQRVKAAEANLRLARAEWITGLDVFLGYGRHKASGHEVLEGGVSIPLPLFHRNQGTVERNRARVSEAEHQARMVKQRLEASLCVVRARCKTIRDELQALLQAVQPAAARGLHQAREGYRAGRLPFLDLIDAQRTHSTVEQRALTLRRDLVLASAELMSLAGAGAYAENESKNGEEQ